jgi:hypothetical protein
VLRYRGDAWRAAEDPSAGQRQTEISARGLAVDSARRPVERLPGLVNDRLQRGAWLRDLVCRVRGGAKHPDGSVWGSRELSVIGGATAAGVVYTSMATPLDRIKTMQQASEGSTAGAHTVAARILRSQGLRGFWVGVLPAMGRNILIDWIQFSAADRLRGWYFGHL